MALAYARSADTVRQRLKYTVVHMQVSMGKMQGMPYFSRFGHKKTTPKGGLIWSGRRGSNSLPPPWQGGALPDELRPHIRKNRSDLVLLKGGASDRNRTNDTGIFSPLLYRLSYRGRQAAFCEAAATRIGLEPTTPSVTGWCSNQLSYRATWWKLTGSNR